MGTGHNDAAALPLFMGEMQTLGRPLIGGGGRGS
jgi:hypothetical protein